MAEVVHWEWPAGPWCELDWSLRGKKGGGRKSQAIQPQSWEGWCQDGKTPPLPVSPSVQLPARQAQCDDPLSDSS